MKIRYYNGLNALLGCVVSLLVLAGHAFGQPNTFPSNGFVGIGTTAPGQMLEISAPTYNNAWEIIRRPGNGQLAWLNFVTGSSTADWGIGTKNNATSDLAIFNYGTLSNAVTVLKSNGFVGVGTESPIAPLHVKGTGTSSQLCVQDATLSDNWQIGTNTGSLSNAHTFSFYSTEYGLSNGYQPIFQLNQTGSVLISPGPGNVGIGTTNPTYKLSVNGTIQAKEVLVQTGWSDYVFAKDYKMMPLSEVEAHISQEGHLPGIPSAKEVAVNGVDVGNVEALLLAKIEEITLRQIDQEKINTAQATEMAKLRQDNAELRGDLLRLSTRTSDAPSK